MSLIVVNNFASFKIENASTLIKVEEISLSGLCGHIFLVSWQETYNIYK